MECGFWRTEGWSSGFRNTERRAIWNGKVSDVEHSIELLGVLARRSPGVDGRPGLESTSFLAIDPESY